MEHTSQGHGSTGSHREHTYQGFGQTSQGFHGTHPSTFQHSQTERDDDYVGLRVSDPREYFAGVRREWAYRREESDRMRDDLIAMGVKVPVRQSLTMYSEAGESPTWSQFRRKVIKDVAPIVVLERQKMCFCGMEPEISNMKTGHALEAVHHLYKEMNRKHYDMKMELWVYYQDKLVAIHAQVIEKVREVETTINDARI
ncbi:hypothetical protein AgCh_003581 [Apium graveolens]